jgi:hypothetical protein
MATYRKKGFVTARQWHKPGDHSQVILQDDGAVCLQVRYPLDWRVNPGDWIIVDEVGVYSILSNAEFTKSFLSTYEKVKEA